MLPEQNIMELERHEVGTQSSAADEPALQLLAGAVAGAVGVWAMDRVDWFNYRLEDPRSRLQTQRVRPGGEDPAHVLARIAERAAGVGLSPAEHHAVGVAVHYAIGIAPAALYGLLRGRMPALRAGRGTLYGLGLFLIQDELINSVTGLATDPRRSSPIVAVNA